MSEVLSNLSLGFSVALSLQNLAFCFLGCVVGTLVGVLPGLGPVATVAMLLPMTFYLEPVTGLIMLAGIFYGAQYGGGITAILLKIPGEASAITTTFDGYQMARQGRAGAALTISALASFFAGTVATLLIVVASPPLAKVAISFGAPEYFALMTFGLVAVVMLARGSALKAVCMVLVGILLATVGTDQDTGALRFTFGMTTLMDGVGFIPVAMGLFGIADILASLAEKRGQGPIAPAKITSLWPSRQDFRESWKPALRGTAIGSLFGVLPGGGPTISTFASYTIEKKISPHPEKFGQGAVEGVAGPEAANNAAAQTAFIPMLDAWHSLQRRAGDHGGIDDHPWHYSRSSGHDQKSGLVLGDDRVDVDRQLDALDPQPAADRDLGENSVDAVSPALPGDPAVLRGRRLLGREQHL